MDTTGIKKDFQESKDASRSRAERRITIERRDASHSQNRPTPLKMQRVGIFVDVQNLFYSAKYQYHAKVDFDKLMKIALNGRQLVRAIAYIVQTPDIDQTSFFGVLSAIGFEIKSKDLKLRADGTAKGDWDMGMAIDSLAMADRLDVIVLISGDGDFVDLVHMLKAKGVVAEVVSFPNNTAEDLKISATVYVPLDNKVLYAETGKPRPPRTEEKQ